MLLVGSELSADCGGALLVTGVCQPVGVGAGFNDGAAEGKSVDNRGAQPGVGKGLGAPAEGFVARDGDGVLFLPLGQNLEQQLSAPFIELHVPKFVQKEKINPPVAVDGLGQLLVVSGLDQFVDQPGGQGIANAESAFSRSSPECNEQMGLAGTGIADQAQRLALADPVAGGQLVDSGWVDVAVGVEVEVAQPFLAWESGRFDPADGGTAVAVVAFGQQELRQQTLIGQLFAIGTSVSVMLRCNNSTSMSSRVPAASPLTRRAAAQNASWAEVNVPAARAAANAVDPGNAPGLMLSVDRRVIPPGCPSRNSATRWASV